MKCPQCQSDMQARHRGEVELDICPSCGGVWLDKGELEKVIEAEQEFHGESAQQNWRLYDRGRDNYDPTPAPAPRSSYLAELIKASQKD